MTETISDLWEWACALTQPYHAHMLYAALSAVAAVLVVRFGLAFLIRETARLRGRNTRKQFRAKSVLLAHEGLAEQYAPAKLFTHERAEDEKDWKLAWLSPYPRAVRASYRRSRVPKGERLEARRQIAEAAKHVRVEGVDGDDAHYFITLKLDGADPERFRKLVPRLVGQLGLHSMEEVQTQDPYSITFLAHESEPRDALVEQKAGAEFFEENPAKTPYSLPLAVKADGSAWLLATHHTLVYGMTGSGKGSVIHGIVTQLAPFVQAGRCELYGIDPKASELRPYAESSLFREVVYETEDAQELIAQLHRRMKRRSKEKKVDLATAQLGRSLDATRETPMMVLVVDELLSLLIALKAKGKEGAGTTTLLTEILAQGRSLGVYVVGATQAVDTELLGRMRINFANVCVLRQESPYFNSMFLGDTAAEEGYDSTAIPLSTKANGYAYAGIGYVKEEGGKPVKVRFAYTSDEDLALLCRRFPKAGLEDFGRIGLTKAVSERKDQEDVGLPDLAYFE